MRQPALTALLALMGLARIGAAQGIHANVGRFYDDEGWTTYRLGVDRPLAGPLSTSQPVFTFDNRLYDATTLQPKAFAARSVLSSNYQVQLTARYAF